jgi:hypothetical protein
MLIETISCITFVTKAVALSTGDTVLYHIAMLSYLNTKLAFMHLDAFGLEGTLVT